jgi:PAS domain S-box-containing protein
MKNTFNKSHPALKRNSEYFSKGEEEFQLLVESVTDYAIFMTDADGYIITWNNGAERIKGYSTTEVLGKHISVFYLEEEIEKGVPEENLKKARELGSFKNEGWRVRKDGSRFWADVAFTALYNEQGNLKGFAKVTRDITEQKKTEQELLKSEKKYQYLFDNNPMPMWIIDLSTLKFLDVNEAAIRHYGYTHEEFLSMTTLDIRPDEEKELFKQHAAIIDSVNYNKGIWKHLKKDGTVIHVEVIAHHIFFEGKKARLILASDMTERINAEEKLQKSIKEIIDYKYALDESSIVAITNQKGIINYVNDNFCKISKYNHQELIGQDHRIINSNYHPKEFIRNLWVTIANGKIWKGELKNKAKDGTIYWVDTTIIPFLNDEGKPYQYVAIRADITERKFAEENLKKTLKEVSDYKYALDESSIVAITDQKGIIKYANKNFCKISKYSEEELIGQDHRIINSGYHSKDFIRNLWVTIANGKIWRGELKNKAKEGTIYWVDTTIVPFLNDDGKPYQYVAIRADITERKLAEENLKKTLKEVSDYKYALDESSIVAITDQKGIIKYANKNFCKISKYSEEELIGQDHRIINSGYHSKDFIRNLWVTIANGKIWRGELKNKAKDRTIYWVDTTIVPFLNDEGKPYQYVAIRADITERKLAEENLKRTLKEVSDYKYALDESSIVAITNQKGIIKYANKNFCKISKYSEEELIGQDHRIINSGYHSKNFIRNLWVTIANGKIWKGELKNRAKDGTFYWVDTTIVPFLDEADKPYQYVAIRADITERKKAEEEILLLNEELESRVKERTTELEFVNKELEAFSYSVSHDLRSPLRAINGYGKMLEEDYFGVFDDEGKRQLKVIQDNAKKMGMLIDDLLAFSRLGRKEINKSFVDMHKLTNNVIFEIERTIPHKAEVTIGELHPVMADYSLITQVMMNLLSNALKYSSKKDDPSIFILSEKKENEIIYSVADNGAGFEKEYMHKLFGVFQRLHSAADFPGTGVGLAIVQRIINRHGGKVWAEGEVDKGATFYFSLPASENSNI